MPNVIAITFSQIEIEAIARALGDTTDGLTGSEIGPLLTLSNIPDIDAGNTKWVRLYNAFCNKQNLTRNRTNILQFIRVSMHPQKYIRYPERFKVLRSNLNSALSFSGLEVKEDGELTICDRVSTLSEAESRANILKLSLKERDIHPDVIKFCRAELLQSNYFHAVFEAVKSICVKLRTISGSIEDGHALIDECLGGITPKLKINLMETKSQRTEQAGFINLVKGIYSMFRSPAAHEAKINWEMTKKDAEDLLTMVSMIHRRIDYAVKNTI